MNEIATDNHVADFVSRENYFDHFLLKKSVSIIYVNPLVKQLLNFWKKNTI